MVETRYAVAIAAALLTAVSHLLLKRGSAPAGRGGLSRRLNAWTIAAYALFLAVTLMNLWAFKVVPLRANVVLSPVTFLCVTAASIALFDEGLTKSQWAGFALIVAGIAIYNLPA